MRAGETDGRPTPNWLSPRWAGGQLQQTGARPQAQAFYAEPGLPHVTRHSARRASGCAIGFGRLGRQLSSSCRSACRTCRRGAARNQPDIEAVAMAQRLDVQAAKSSARSRPRRTWSPTRTTRFINVLELGLVRVTSNEDPRQTGWGDRHRSPLFDWGGAVARAEAICMPGAAPRSADADQRPLGGPRSLRQSTAPPTTSRAIQRERDRAAQESGSPETGLRYTA